MKIGIFKTSLKENEFRVPIYPEHLPRIPINLRQRLVFEADYGMAYGYNNDYFLSQGASILHRKQLLASSNIIILPKPMTQDLSMMKSGQVLFGWAHCVQQKKFTQLAIDNKLTVIAWEAMHHWSQVGEKLLHIFYKNNEIAGYSAVLHCLQLLGIDGHYGPRRKVVIFGYGSVSRGAIYALQGRGFNNIHVLTQRKPHLVADQNPDVYYGQFYYGPDGILIARNTEGLQRPLIEEISDADIICNGILQDTNQPIIFVSDSEIKKLKPRSIIIDISCDEAMGFSFAKPTSFNNPVFTLGEDITYYSVDHTPAYLWNAASREISKAIIPFLEDISSGEKAWESNITIKRAIEIREGIIKNVNILKFQNRGIEYPHAIL